MAEQGKRQSLEDVIREHRKSVQRERDQAADHLDSLDDELDEIDRLLGGGPDDDDEDDTPAPPPAPAQKQPPKPKAR